MFRSEPDHLALSAVCENVVKAFAWFQTRLGASSASLAWFVTFAAERAARA